MWGSWGSYSTCTKSCGIGTQTRSRKCNNPAPAGGGSACTGDSKETSNCNIQPCPSTSNNNAFNLEFICISFISIFQNNITLNSLCFLQFNCPFIINHSLHILLIVIFKVEGNWGSWGNWTCSECSSSGLQTRTRFCDNPKPEHEGAHCEYSNDTSTTTYSNGITENGTQTEVESQSCKNEPCPG